MPAPSPSAAGALPEFERLDRRTLHAFAQIGVSGPDGLLRSGIPAPRRSGVRGSLAHRAEPPGTRQRDHRAGNNWERFGANTVPRTTRRNAALLPSRGRVAISVSCRDSRCHPPPCAPEAERDTHLLASQRRRAVVAAATVSAWPACTQVERAGRQRSGFWTIRGVPRPRFSVFFHG